MLQLRHVGLCSYVVTIVTSSRLTSRACQVSITHLVPMRRPKIVQGRVAKTINQRALLEQAYIKDGNKTVGEVVKEAIAGIGENIKIRRFERCASWIAPPLPGRPCGASASRLPLHSACQF